MWSPTTNSQYGQWFDLSRRTSINSASVARHAPRQHHDQSTSRTDTLAAADHTHASRDHAAPRDLPSRDDDSPRTDNHGVSRRPDVALPLSLQRCASTLGRFSASVSGVDGLSGQVHADLMRDYQRYRRLQAGSAGETGVWRDASRLLTRASGVGGGPSSTINGSACGQQQRRTDTETTTVVPLQLAVSGPVPLQRSVVNVVTARRPPADFRRTHSGYAAGPGRPVTSLLVNNDVNIASPSDSSDVIHQLNALQQVEK